MAGGRLCARKGRQGSRRERSAAAVRCRPRDPAGQARAKGCRRGTQRTVGGAQRKAHGEPGTGAEGEWGVGRGGGAGRGSSRRWKEKRVKPAVPDVAPRVQLLPKVPHSVATLRLCNRWEAVECAHPSRHTVARRGERSARGARKLTVRGGMPRQAIRVCAGRRGCSWSDEGRPTPRLESCGVLEAHCGRHGEPHLNVLSRARALSAVCQAGSGGGVGKGRGRGGACCGFGMGALCRGRWPGAWKRKREERQGEGRLGGT